MQHDDAIITRIRQARHQISEEQAHDPERVVAYYVELQKRYLERIIESRETEEEMQDSNV
jgi:hypothetical protein